MNVDDLRRFFEFHDDVNLRPFVERLFSEGDEFIRQVLEKSGIFKVFVETGKLVFREVCRVRMDAFDV